MMAREIQDEKKKEATNINCVSIICEDILHPSIYVSQKYSISCGESGK
jgi:hypothetical protein